MRHTPLKTRESESGVSKTKVSSHPASGLLIGDARNSSDREADRVADEVMSGWGSPASLVVGERAADRAEGVRMRVRRWRGAMRCLWQEKRDGEKMQRKESAAGARNSAADCARSAETAGQPLDLATRAFTEPRFGRDFNDVRIHTDAKATESASAVKAKAYTVGQHIVFGHGQYAGDSERGRRLLAHELTHVVQQGSGQGELVSQSASLSISSPGDRAEREAEQVAGSISDRNVPASVVEKPTASLARDPLDVSALSNELDKTATVGVPIGSSPVMMGLPFIKYLGKHPQEKLPKQRTTLQIQSSHRP